MKFLRTLQINSLVTAIVYIALGILFILLPDVVSQWIATILGIALALAGIAYIIGYFRRWQIEYKSNGLAIGILMIFGALFLFFKSEVIFAAIPILLGFAVVVSGTIKLQNSIVLFRVKDKLWPYVMGLAALTLIIGILFIVIPFAYTSSLIVMIGVGLLVSGVTDLVIIFLMSRRVGEFKAGAVSDIIDTEHVQSPTDAVREAVDGFTKDN